MPPSLTRLTVAAWLSASHFWLWLSGCSADAATLDGPTQAIVASDGRVYVSDGYFHARIAVFTQEGRFVDAWGSKGFERGQLQTPHGLAAASDDTLLVADRDNGRLQEFTLGGKLVRVIEDEVLGRPWSVAVRGDGARVVADGGDQRGDAPRAGIVELDSAGHVVRRFGSYGQAPGELNEPHMLAVAPGGDIIVAEIGNARLQRFTPANGCDPADAGCEFELVAGWPRLDTNLELDPLSVATDGTLVYVGHQGSPASVWALDLATGARQAVLGEGLFERPHGLGVDGAHTLWVADDHGNRVVHLTADGRLIATLGGRR